MLKKYLTMLGVGVLICFSFYYTDSAVGIAVRNDPIMKQIIKVSKDYEKEAIDAVLVNNCIIPGISGEAVDIDKSYESMKRYGEFNSSLLVFKEVLPTVNITNNYDRYIIKGNPRDLEVSLVFKIVNTNYIEEIIEILNNKDVKAVFFLNEDIFEEHSDILRRIFLNGHNIEFYSSDYNELNIGKNNRILTSVNMNKLKYCYIEQEDNRVLEICKKEKLHTIIPNIITDKTPYKDIKNGLLSGSVIVLNNNPSTIRELNSIINYVIQKGYKIVLLDDLLKE